MRWDLAGDAVHAMQDSAMGNRTLAGWLREVRAHLEKEGELTAADVQRFVFHGKSKHYVEEIGGTACFDCRKIPTVPMTPPAGRKLRKRLSDLLTVN